MRYVTIVCFLVFPLLLAAQSKKELQQEVDRLKGEIEELKKPKAPVIDMNDKHQQAGYAIGVLLAENLRSQGGDSLNATAIATAINDVYLNKPLQVDQQECLAIVQPYMQSAMDARNAKLKEENLAFLEENKKDTEVKVTPTGLQYKIITVGSGRAPGLEDSVTVHYKGKLIDGTVFDQSAPDSPITFTAGEVIPGWTEALLLMHEGDKWEIYLPYPLAYGERGAGSEIPPFSTLIFEIELLKVTPGGE